MCIGTGQGAVSGGPALIPRSVLTCLVRLLSLSGRTECGPASHDMIITTNFASFQAIERSRLVSDVSQLYMYRFWSRHPSTL